MNEEEKGRDGDSVGDERNQGRVEERGKYKRWLGDVRRGKERRTEREERKRGRIGGKERIKWKGKNKWGRKGEKEM